MSFETSIPAEQMLANAIIIQAADDYRAALRSLKHMPDSSAAAGLLEDCESFFLSDWFMLLTALDGESLMQRLRREESDLLPEGDASCSVT